MSFFPLPFGNFGLKKLFSGGYGSWEDGRWCWKIKWRRPFFMEAISSVQMLVIEDAWTCQVDSKGIFLGSSMYLHFL